MMSVPNGCEPKRMPSPSKNGGAKSRVGQPVTPPLQTFARAPSGLISVILYGHQPGNEILNLPKPIFVPSDVYTTTMIKTKVMEEANAALCLRNLFKIIWRWLSPAVSRFAMPFSFKSISRSGFDVDFFMTTYFLILIRGSTTP